MSAAAAAGTADAPVVLYDYLPSGNGYKVRLVCKLLGIRYRLVEMDIKQGATRTAQFLEKNPNGRIPLLEVPGNGFLAEGSELIPSDPWERALMAQWLCFEQYNLEPNIGTARFWLTSLHKTPAELGERLAEKWAKGREALAVLERGLSGRQFLVGGRCTLADIALFAYTHVADEAGLSLDGHLAIRDWIARVTAQPGYAPITAP